MAGGTILTVERLKELLHYEPETGVFTWLIVPNGRVKVGAQAGCIENNGYVRIGIDGHRHQAHHLAHLYMTGAHYPGQLDHKDLSRSNNRWKNLRPATNSQNVHNRRFLVTNTSGFKGVCWHRRRNKWGASISKDGLQRHLGYYDDPRQAHSAYQAAANKLFGEFARAA